MPNTMYEKISTLKEITVKLQNKKDEEKILIMG